MAGHHPRRGGRHGAESAAYRPFSSFPGVRVIRLSSQEVVELSEPVAAPIELDDVHVVQEADEDGVLA